MLFEERVFKRLASPDAFRGGRELALARAVRNVEVERNRFQDYVAKGEIIGNTASQQSELVIATNKQTVKSHKCTCSFDRQGMCKHVIALGLSARDPAIPSAGDRQAMLKAALMSGRRLNAPTTATRQTILSPSKGGAGVMFKNATATFAQTDAGTITHDLEEIRFLVRYELEDDILLVSAEAKYGPFNISIFAPEPTRPHELKDDRGTHQPLRDLAIEAEARQWFKEALEDHRVDGDGAIMIEGEAIYTFIKETYPEIEFRYPVDLDPSAEDVMRVLQEPVEGVWSSRLSSGIDLFSFSVQLHCKGADISLEEVKKMVIRGKPFLRLPDGRFMEVENQHDLTQMVEVLQKARPQKDGFTIPLYEAPGFLSLFERSRQQRLTEMDSRFQAFVAEAQKGKMVQMKDLPEGLDKILRPYQKEGVAWMLFLQKYGFGGVLADDMGLGKTLQVLTLLEKQRLERLDPKNADQKHEPTLIVCPKSLMQMWALEAKKFTPDLKVIVVDGTVGERAEIVRRRGDVDILITSYSLLQRDLAVYHATDAAFSLLVLDEAHSIKNAGTNTAKAVKLLPAKHRLALTGTPLENGVHELWSIFDFLMPGFLGDAEMFRRRYGRPIQELQDKEALKRLRDRVGAFMLRRTKESQLKDLPPKIEQVSPCELTAEQLVIYARVLESTRKQVFQAVETKGIERSHIDILAALTKLRRVCDHPTLVEPSLPRTEELSGKMAYALELIHEAVSGGHKILLFSQFTSMLDLLREALDREGIGHCTIEGKTRDRQAEVDRFHNDPTASVFLLSLRAGGTGLTLTPADVVILFDPWWNPMAEQQAMDRAHRIGQTKTVNVYKLVTQGTIEEKVMELQARKRQLFDALVSENAEAMRGLSWEEVKGLFA